MLKKNNKGMSLVEMLASVTILSIVMGGAFWMLSVMTKSFTQSQREVELQNSVQSTYNIVSDLIQEANIDGTGDSVEFSGNNAVIHVDNVSPTGAKVEKYYVLTLENNCLYLGENQAASDIAGEPANLLAKNVDSYNIDTSTLGNGYVVLTVTAKSGDKTSTITQNVFLRNSNAMGNISTYEGGDPLTGYHIKAINSITNNTSYKSGQRIDKGTLSIDATWENEEGDVKDHGIVPSSMITQFYKQGDSTKTSVDGTAITSDFTAVLEFAETEVTATVDLAITVSGDSTTCTYITDLLDETVTEKSKISVNSDINAYYHVDSTAGSKVCKGKDGYNCNTVITSDDYYTDAYGNQGYICPNVNCPNHRTYWRQTPGYKGCFLDNSPKVDHRADGTVRCANCGSILKTKEIDGTTYYYCPLDNTRDNPKGVGRWDNGGIEGWCENHVNDNELGQAEQINYETAVHPFSYCQTNYTLASTGKLIITNDSTDNDYSNVKVVIYLGDAADDSIKFKKISASEGFLRLTGAKNSDASISYRADGNTTAKFIELNLGSMPHGNKTENEFTTFEFEYAWSGGSATDVIPLSVYSISYN